MVDPGLAAGEVEVAGDGGQIDGAGALGGEGAGARERGVGAGDVERAGDGDVAGAA